MTGLMQRIFRRRASGSHGRGDDGPPPPPPDGSSRRRRGRKRAPWGKKAEQPAQLDGATDVTTDVVAEKGSASFRERGKLRRRLRYLRRARELAFRDVGGLLFEMRRFQRDRPDLLEAKVQALAAVDQELRSLERVLDDRRAIHELREPGLTSCARCGALHASEDHFCPRCGLQLGGPQAMGEVGGAIAAPPQPPPRPPSPPQPARLFGPPPTQPPSPTDQPTGILPGITLDPAQHDAPSGGSPSTPGDLPGRTGAGDEPHTEIYRPPDQS
jgi:ribosomal protein L32